MSAFEKWWDSVAVTDYKPEFKWHAEQGWNAAIKNMEAQNTSTNSAMVPCERWSAGGFLFAESCGWKFCPVCGVSLAQHQ